MDRVDACLTYYCQFLSLYTKAKMLRHDSIHRILHIRRIHLATPDKMSY